MNKLRCCVIDDEPLASGLIASYILKTPFLELAGEYSSPNDATSAILSGDIDIVFLDINMPQISGVEFARIIPPSTRVVFTTAYDSYAVEGFRLNALDYLLKPVSYPEFLEAANRALKWKESVDVRQTAVSATVDERFIIVKSEYKLIQIAIDDILYIEGLKDYVRIYTASRERPVMTLLSMKSIESKLPEPQFMRVHRSLIVNTSRITTIERNRIVFGESYVPISDSYRQMFNDFITARTLDPRNSD